MKKILSILILILFFNTHCFSDNHKTNFKDIKGYKKQFISMSEKKVNRIKEVKASEGFPVYEGKTSIQVTVNNSDYNIFAFGCFDNIFINSKPIYPVAPAIAIFIESFIFNLYQYLILRDN